MFGKVDAQYFAASTKALLGTYRKQVWSEKPEALGTDEVADACKIVVQSLDRLRASKRMRFWKVSDELCLMQIFLSALKDFF